MVTTGMPPSERYTDLSLTAQTAYAETAEQAQTLKLQASLSGLPGAFHKRTITGC